MLLMMMMMDFPIDCKKKRWRPPFKSEAQTSGSPPGGPTAGQDVF